MRKKQWLTETRKKLEGYRDVLITRILAKLDFHALQQIEHFGMLDQNIRDLAVTLSEGPNAVQRLLVDQTITIQKHIDRRNDEKANDEAIQRNRQQFRNSLFFPEIFARQESIPKSHKGTCKWIFGMPQTDGQSQPDTEGFQAPGQQERVDGPRAQPWSNFGDWLKEDNKDPYWLSGKPGSGKSTLMKYVSTEFACYCESDEEFFHLRDAVTCSFFFWNLGSSLQKDYVGFMRSILFQIAQQRVEMIPILRGDRGNVTLGKADDSCLMHAWTEERLDEALKRFLARKPSSMRVCMFIDGLDEFVGDEDRLIDIIRLLSQTSGVKICVSSRPEQIFRQGFATSPTLRLQNYNYFDIKKATEERLSPTLTAHVLCSEDEIDKLINEVVEKSQGIFLWAELITKDLKMGAKNADSIQELKRRLYHTPQTIEGFYEHMLNRLDKAYVPEAARYFRHLLLYHGYTRCELPPTVLEIACMNGNPWTDPLCKVSNLLGSLGIESCRRAETRILACCAGLVEIHENPLASLACVWPKKGVQVNPKKGQISQHFREIKFIHKTAVDFIKKHQVFFDDPDWQSTGRLAAVRGQIAVASLAPDIIREQGSAQGGIDVSPDFIHALMNIFWLSDEHCQTLRDAAIRMIDEIYDVLGYLNRSLNGSNHIITQSYTLDLSSSGLSILSYKLPSQGRLSFAAHFGRYDYVVKWTARSVLSQQDIEAIVQSAIFGILWAPFSIEQLRGLLHILLECGPMTRDFGIGALSYTCEGQVIHRSLWNAFLTFSCPQIEFRILLMERYPNQYGDDVYDVIKLWTNVMRVFLGRDARADPNTTIALVLALDVKSSVDHKQIWIYCQETILAHVQRVFRSFMCTHMLKDIEDPLRAHGCIARRVFHSVGYLPDDADSMSYSSTDNDAKGYFGDDDVCGRYSGDHRVSKKQLVLTKNQSQRLVDALSSNVFRKVRYYHDYPETWSKSPIPTETNPVAEDIVNLIVDHFHALDESSTSEESNMTTYEEDEVFINEEDENREDVENEENEEDKRSIDEEDEDKEDEFPQKLKDTQI